MLRLKRPERSETKTRIAHGLAGLTILLEGWERLEDGARVGGACMLTMGLLLLLLARFHKRLHHSAFAAHLDSAALMVEGIVMGTIAALYFERGKHLLPWCYAGVTVAYLILAGLRRGRVAGSR